MSQSHTYQFIPHMPVSDPEMAPSLQRTLTRSRSSLWRVWSPGLPSFSEYERTAYKFPWLQDPDGSFSRQNHGNRHSDIILETPGPTDRSHLLSHVNTQNDPSMIPRPEKFSHEQGNHSDDPEDPDLVGCTLFLLTLNANRTTGNMVWAVGPNEPQELAQAQEMDSHHLSFLLHFHITGVLDNACAST